MTQSMPFATSLANLTNITTIINYNALTVLKAVQNAICQEADQLLLLDGLLDGLLIKEIIFAMNLAQPVSIIIPISYPALHAPIIALLVHFTNLEMLQLIPTELLLLELEHLLPLEVEEEEEEAEVVMLLQLQPLLLLTFMILLLTLLLVLSGS